MRKSLYPGSSLAALTVALCAMPQAAQANGFLGTPTVQSGSVTFDRTPLTSETITVDSNRAIINWVPDDNTGTANFTFLPIPNSVNYVASTAQQSVGPYVVLNRILPTNTARAAVFDGLVTDVTGGNGIWFYTPGGFIIGANARFNVGNIVLSTGDFAETAGEFFPGSSNFSVSNTVGSNATVRIFSGAQINATAENSFVVAVAPRIVQGGAITVNGSAALVAAEAVDFTYNAGLFDITTVRGTEVAGTAFDHNGTTTGPASSGAGDNHRIYMAAVPKNTAITMLVQSSGDIGFDIAGAADVDGNSIVLSAGHNIVGGAGDPLAGAPVNATPVDLRIRRGNYTSNVIARGSGIAEVGDFTPAGNPDISFASNLSLRGTSATLVGNQGTVTVTGDANINADAFSLTADGVSRTGGSASIISLTGAAINLLGNATVTARGTGGASTTGNAGNGTGGFAQISSGSGATGGIVVGSNLVVDGSGRGGNGPTGGGAATGGQALILAQTNSVLDITGSALALATAIGGNGTTGPGGNAVGGTARINPAGIIGVGLDATVTVSGFGGNSGSGNGGTAQGGVGFINAFGAGSETNIIGSAFVRSDSRAGNSANAIGGAALGGGSAQITADGGAVTIGGDAVIETVGDGGTGATGGGNATSGNSLINAAAAGGSVTITGNAILNAAVGGGLVTGAGSGGTAQGGSASVQTANASGTVSVGGDLSLNTIAFGGGFQGTPPAPAGTISGATTGGDSFISTNGGRIETTGSGSIVSITSDAFGGSAATVGAATGGLARIVGNGGTIDLASTVNLSAGATGGNSDIGAGGAASGGQANINATGATIRIAGVVDQRTFALGGNGVTGGNATGGRGFASSGGAIGLLDLQGALTIDHSSRGGNGTSGNGGNAGSVVGGGFGLTAGSGGTSRVAGNFEIFINANGGNSAGGNGGEGRVSTSANIFAAGGTVQVTGNFLGQATGTGGSVTGAGVAGNGIGGMSGVQTNGAGSAITITGTTNMLVEGRGGVGTASSPTGAIGTGGFAFVFANNGNIALNGTSLTLGASGLGGTAAAGGNGVAGRIAVGAQTGGTLNVAGSTSLTVNGLGGNAISGRGGDGLANPTSSSDVFVFNGGNVTTGAIQFNGNVIGGAGGAGASGGGTGGRGGDAIGGIGTSIGSTTSSGTMTTGAVTVSANAIGGAGGVGGIGATGGTGGAGGIGRGGFSGAGTSDQTAAGTAGNFTFGNVQVSSNGFGGAGGAGGSGTIQGNGGAGGTGQGGTASFGGAGGTIVATGTMHNVNADGTGGAGGAGPVFGNGGAGTGGTAVTGARFNNITPALTSRFTLNGGLLSGARGIGGASGAGGTGGNATGGMSRNGSTGASATYNGNVLTPTTALGGAGGTGGNATGGVSDFISRAGATVAVNGTLIVSGSGIAGAASDAGALGGNGRGGTHQIDVVDASTLSVTNTVQIEANGTGGVGDGSGSGTGGTAAFNVRNTSTATLSSSVMVNARGISGEGVSATAARGNALGGTATVFVENSSALSAGSILVAAGAPFGGTPIMGTGGTNRAGTARISTAGTGSTVTAGSLVVIANAFEPTPSAGAGRNVFGGLAEVLANGGTIRATNAGASVQVSAFATGGDGATAGGSATGGTARIHGFNGGVFEGAGDVFVGAGATAGNSSGGNGGTAIAGLAEFQTNPSTASRAQAAGNLTVNAAALGGSGAVAGGTATGGTARIATGNAGDVISVASFDIQTTALGGNGTSGAGGFGTGGNGIVFIPGGSITSATGGIDAEGQGGNGAIGGAGTGGRAEVFATSGSFTLTDPGFRFDIEAEGEGGDGSNGNGGTATGGFASLRTQPGGGGSISIASGLNLEARAEGGDATGATGNGGDAIMGGTQLRAVQSPITIGGATLIENFGIGGNGVNGGNVLLPTMIPSGPAIQSNNTTITLGAIDVQTYGIGGNGRDGGRGGNAQSASLFLVTEDGNVAIPSFINGGNLTVDARATGGAGGAGISGLTGGNGGAGGTAVGSPSQIFARATNGRVTLGAINYMGQQSGGVGGAGGAGSSGAGGNGGAGGLGGDIAVPGFANIQIGTFSGAGAPTIDGYNRSTSITADVNGTGGAGGASGLGTTDGAAGAGGSAAAGGVIVLIRGSEVTSGAVSITAQAFGGQGGIDRAGQVSGAGGNALGGGAVIVGSPHFVTTTETATGTFASFSADTSATGGASGTSAGGTGTGGESAIRLEENGAVVTGTGLVTVNGPVVLSANGSGGTSRSGAGGAGTGGLARIENLKGTVSVTGAVTANARGLGGLTQTGTGGVGTGGMARIGANGVATSIGGTLDLMAQGQGGAGRAGGAGAGGTASAVVTSGSLSVAGLSIVNVDASGGNAVAGLGGAGGDATAGTVRVEADSPGSNVTMSFANLTAQAIASGGGGGSFGAMGAALGLPAAGGSGGTATGGSVSVGSTSSAGTLTFGAITASSNGFANAGGSAGNFGPGGAGGNSNGGTTRVGFGGAPATATGTLVATSIVAGAVTSTGFAGTGTTLGAAGNAVGGTAIVGNLAGGALSVSGSVTAAANAVHRGNGGTSNGGNALLLTSPNPNAGGASSFTIGGPVNLQASGVMTITGPQGNMTTLVGNAGRAAIRADGGNINFAQANVSSFGNGGVTNVAPFRGIVASGISAGNATIQTPGAISIQSGAGNVGIFTDNGTISSGNFTAVAQNIVESLNGAAPVAPGALISTGSVSVSAPGSIITRTRFQSAGAATFTANGALTIGGAMSGNMLTLDAMGDINGGDIVAIDVFEVLSGGNLTFGTIRAESDIDIGAQGNIVTGALSTGDSVLIGAGGSVTTGNIDAGVLRPTTDPQAGFGVGIRANGNVSTGSITARGPVGLGSETGSVTAGAVQTQDSFLVLARTGAELGAITTGANGTTYIADSSMLSLLDPVTLDPAPIFAATPVALAGPVTVGAVSTNRFVAASTGAFTAQGSITAPARVDVRTGAAATFNGAVSSAAIAVRSADIVIGTNGGLGGLSTQSLDLLVDPAAAAVAFGGASATNGYSLSGDEASRLRAQTISFTMQSVPTRPTVVPLTLGSFALRGGSAGSAANLLGTAGTLRIVTPGAIAVTGVALVSDAASGNIVEIVAGGRIEINANSGTIRLTNGAEVAGGLRLSGSDIWSADATTLEMLRDNVDFTGRDARLNAGRATSSVPVDVPVTNPGIGGGTITVSVDDTLLIANTGSAREQAGFEAGVGGISVSARVAAPRPGQQSGTADLPPGTIDVVINGTARGSDGSLLTNRRTLEAFQLGSGTTATPNSSVNGCNLGSGICAGGQGDPVTMASIQASLEPRQLTEQAEEDRKEAEEAVAASEKRPNAVVSRLIEGATVNNEDLIDEPVTGGGNPSLWDTTPSGAPR